MNFAQSEARDPICGMTVDRATAPRAEREGQTYYFCSERCQKEFQSQSPNAKPEAKPEATSKDR